MKRNFFIVMLLIVAATMAGCSGGSKPLTDRDVLMLLYNSLNGDNWEEDMKENWGSELPLSEWEGIKADENDRVISLSISGDSVRGIVPEEIGQLTELKKIWLSVSNNTPNQPLPAAIGHLSNLEFLSLEVDIQNGSDLVFPSFEQLVNLKELYLSGPARSYQGLEKLQNLKALEIYGLRNDIPDAIWKLTNLERLWIVGDQFTGSLSPEIGNLKKMKSLKIDKSAFIGKVASLQEALPETIWELENLEILFLRRACVGGTISPNVSNLKKIRQINIINCGLTGEIPNEIYTLPEITKLELYNNQLTGTLSPEVGNLATLEYLWVNDNQLAGTLPATLGKLSKLESLKVENNQFTGAIPAELANCPLDGVFVNFKGNQFSGDIAPALRARPTFSKWEFDK